MVVRSSGKGFVLITAAHNEESVIGASIEGVLRQSVLPARWIIVSDRSSDGTDKIIRMTARAHPFIRFLRRDGDAFHDFRGKIAALNAATELLAGLSFEYIGVLDADVVIPAEYFERIFERFRVDYRLGIAGGIIIECRGARRVRQTLSTELSVAGAVQMFRALCFQQIGGFPSMPYGSEDAAMEIIARRLGWKVHTFTDLEVVHAGPVGRAAGNILRAKFRRGMSYYDVGYHPLFQIARSLSRLTDWPQAGSLLESAGFFYRWARGKKPLLPKDVVRFLRREQLSRLKPALPG